MAHTPGPWQAVRDFIGTDETDPQTIAYCSDHRNRRRRTSEEAEANARLIAAAPDLLTACQALLDAFNDYEMLPALAASTQRLAETAIAKATGGAE